MAGALGIQLGGPATYGGVPSDQPRLVDAGRPLTADTVRQAEHSPQPSSPANMSTTASCPTTYANVCGRYLR